MTTKSLRNHNYFSLECDQYQEKLCIFCDAIYHFKKNRKKIFRDTNFIWTEYLIVCYLERNSIYQFQKSDRSHINTLTVYIKNYWSLTFIQTTKHSATNVTFFVHQRNYKRKFSWMYQYIQILCNQLISNSLYTYF